MVTTVRRWLNRNVLAIGLTSLLGDFCHEMATSVLPQFMQAIGASAAALGFIEGVADALSSFVKLGAGYHSDKIGHRKAWTVIGYALTAMSKAVFAFAFAWPLIILGRAGLAGELGDHSVMLSWRNRSLHLIVEEPLDFIGQEIRSALLSVLW